jgi:hypothetical protein
MREEAKKDANTNKQMVVDFIKKYLSDNGLTNVKKSPTC